MTGRFVKRWSGAGSQRQVTSADSRLALESAAAAWRALRSVERRESKVLAGDHVLSLKVGHGHLMDAHANILAALQHTEDLLTAAGEPLPDRNLADALNHTTWNGKPDGQPNPIPGEGTPDGSSQGKQNTPASSGDGSGSRSAPPRVRSQ